MAAIRLAVVCRVHDIDHWQLAQGGNPYETPRDMHKVSAAAKTIRRIRRF